MEQAFESGVLNKQEHVRLIDNIDKVCERAGIQKHFVWTPLAESCPDPDEQKWVREFPQLATTGCFGLIYLGLGTEPIEYRMQGIAGCLLRNFVNARLMRWDAIIAYMQENSGPPADSCVLVPETLPTGGNYPAWRLEMIMSFVMTRYRMEKQTVLYHAGLDLEVLKSRYSVEFQTFLLTRYKPVQIGDGK